MYQRSLKTGFTVQFFCGLGDRTPFQIRFSSDEYEFAPEAGGANAGFRQELTKVLICYFFKRFSDFVEVFSDVVTIFINVVTRFSDFCHQIW